MKRRCILIFFAVVIVFGITACTPQEKASQAINHPKQQSITLYSLTGTMQIDASEMEEYLDNGWYIEPVVTMYAADGRTRVTLESEIEAYKGVGWYTEPVVTMYAADGRTRVTLKSEIEAYKGVGWYTEPVVTMYAADGRTRVTLESEVEAYKNVGWYTEPVVTMYATDGRTRVTLESEVEAYKGVGWYVEPVIIMYAADGRTRVTLESEVEAYKNVGWYTEPIKVVTKTQPKLYLKASASDSEFLSFANENYATLAFIQGYVSMGAYFHVNYDVKIPDSSAPYGGWWLVDDEVSNMEELKTFWYSHFSQSSDKSMYTSMYKEFDGKLYSACPGVGGSDAGKPNYTKVNKISNNRIEIIGTIAQYDEYGEYWDTRNSSIIMVMENNIWMCERVR